MNDDDDAEDAADVRACDEFKRKLATGEEEMIPAEIVNRILDGENKVCVWREHRGLSPRDLAEKAGIIAARLAEIEADTRAATADELSAIAAALRLEVEDLTEPV